MTNHRLRYVQERMAAAPRRLPAVIRLQLLNHFDQLRNAVQEGKLPALEEQRLVGLLSESHEQHSHAERLEELMAGRHKGVNPSQLQALRAAAFTEGFTQIQGPPGSGKSHVRRPDDFVFVAIDAPQSVRASPLDGCAAPEVATRAQPACTALRSDQRGRARGLFSSVRETTLISVWVRRWRADA
jgi:hypothetical protein